MAVKLYYFPMTGLGEPVRLMLSYGNIKFEDIRVPKDKWAEMKKEIRFGQLPKLEIEGKVLFQSRTICRYLAKKLNLCGKDDWQATLCDMMVDTLDDWRGRVVRFYYANDGEEREQGLKELRETTVPDLLKKFEEHVTENGGFFVGGKLTWADIYFLSMSDYITHMLDEDLIPHYTKLKELQDYVKSQPGVANYLKNRPSAPEDMRKIFS